MYSRLTRLRAAAIEAVVQVAACSLVDCSDQLATELVHSVRFYSPESTECAALSVS